GAPAAAERRAAARSETGASRDAPTRALGRAGAGGLAVAVPEMTGRLVTDDRAAAEAGLRDLLARVGATEVSRRRDGGALVVEIVLPRTAYRELAARLARLGRGPPDPAPSPPSREVPL